MLTYAYRASCALHKHIKRVRKCVHVLICNHAWQASPNKRSPNVLACPYASIYPCKPLCAILACLYITALVYA